MYLHSTILNPATRRTPAERKMKTTSCPSHQPPQLLVTSRLLYSQWQIPPTAACLWALPSRALRCHNSLLHCKVGHSPGHDTLLWQRSDLTVSHLTAKTLPYFFFKAFEELASQFLSQEIDGQALLLLKEEHLMSTMNIRLGPALKLCACINSLRD